MRCCYPGCKNDSRKISKTQGITFHAFPTDPQLRSAWLQSINRPEWEPKERSFVCSVHFPPSELYETRRGFRKVRGGATPIMQEPPLRRTCRICLAMDRRMVPLASHGLDGEYQLLTGLSTSSEDNVLPPNLCYECCQRLRGSTRLRQRSLTAHELLTAALNKEALNSATLKSIQQEAQISENLHEKHFEPNHYDLILIDDKEATDKLIDLKTDQNDTSLGIDEIPLDVEIKDESSNIFYIMNESEQTIENENENEAKNESIESDSEINFDLANSDKGFSSDDSLPLERRRTKKKSVKKPGKDRTKTVKTRTGKTGKKRQVKKDPSEPKVDRRRKPFLNNDLNETLFTITDLTTEEQIAEIVKRQESANYKNAIYKCTECYKGFLDEDAYNTHMSRHTNQCGDHQCDICKTHFKHQHALRKHITAHHTQRFSCNQCTYVTTHRQTARLHERWHKGTKYQCPHCPDEFVKFTTYMGHIRIKHPSDFVCQLCGYSFVSEKGIDLHKKLKHRSETDEIPADGPRCESCAIRFATEEAYRQHLRVSARHSEHKDSRESNKPKKRKSKESGGRERAPVGDKDASEDARRYPSQIRKAEGPIPCEQCGLQLSDSRAYHGHFRRAHPDKNRTNYPSMRSPCMCEVCGRMFQSYALLKDHTWVHTGERPFKCDACGKSFRMKQRLVTHRRVHSQMKATYVCNLCGKHFSTHSNRQRHMFIHTGLKPFKCEMCGKCFKHASEKRAHITYVHLKKPWPKRARGKRRDSRQSMQPPPIVAPGDVTTPSWPQCEHKLDHGMPIGGIVDKHMYYNLKI